MSQRPSGRASACQLRANVKRALTTAADAACLPGAYSIWGFVRPNNWDGYQTCGILRKDIEFKMDDDDCGKGSYGFICGDIRMSSLLFLQQP